VKIGHKQASQTLKYLLQVHDHSQ